ncbi:MAG: hypothetical protein IPJ65_38255 [Archangiaceae bacterium]|nr:hypothetical protein [Archangiaceae bacterium]
MSIPKPRISPPSVQPWAQNATPKVKKARKAWGKTYSITLSPELDARFKYLLEVEGKTAYAMLKAYIEKITENVKVPDVCKAPAPSVPPPEVIKNPYTLPNGRIVESEGFLAQADRLHKEIQAEQARQADK